MDVKAILIDAAARDIRAVDYDGLADLQKMVGGYIEVAKMWSSGDTLFVDEEGKRKGHLVGFMLPDRRDIFVGNGVVVGRELDDTAETAAPGLTVAMLIDMVQWFSARPTS